METTEVTLKAEQMPPSFMRCYLDDCPRTGECIRYLARNCIPDGTTSGNAVYPTARQDGTCRWFKQTRVIRKAWGFSRLFDEVKAKDLPAMRKKLHYYLGSKMEYYRYSHGLKKLTPEQQQWVGNLFRSYGYGVDLKYDNYADEYDFG